MLSISLMQWEIQLKKYITELIKKRSKVYKKDMTIERALSFDQS